MSKDIASAVPDLRNVSLDDDLDPDELARTTGRILGPQGNAVPVSAFQSSL